MDFVETMRKLAEHVAKSKEYVNSEDDTKQYLVLPFFEALGYNPFDPTEVRREYNPEMTHAGQTRADFMILKEGKPIVSVECKKLGHALGEDAIGQLARYFTFSDATIGVLTDGVRYRLFTDAEKQNVMDEHPFLDFHMGGFEDVEVEVLEWLTKSSFAPELMVVAAGEYRDELGVEGSSISEVTTEEPKEESIEFPQIQIDGVPKSIHDQDEFQPRDYEVRDAFGEILQDIVPDNNALELGTPPKANYTFLKLHNSLTGARKRLARVERTRDLRVSLYIWDSSRKRTRTTVKTWEELRGYRDKLREYASHFLGRR